MSQYSGIEWTDATWNPVTGCTKVSEGCRYCYAETFAERWRGVPGHPYQQGFDLKLWPDRLGLPLRWRKPRRVFVNSMSDLFHNRVPFEFIDRVFETMIQCNWHQFQVLTKRPGRMSQYIRSRVSRYSDHGVLQSHIWLGTTIESQRYISRAYQLSTLPAAVRFLSCEPLLGALDLQPVLGPEAINWVIVGGESGRRARPMDEAWVIGIRDQCLQSGIPFFFKQWGGKNKKLAGRLLQGRVWDEEPTASVIGMRSSEAEG